MGGCSTLITRPGTPVASILVGWPGTWHGGRAWPVVTHVEYNTGGGYGVWCSTQTAQLHFNEAALQHTCIYMHVPLLCMHIQLCTYRCYACICNYACTAAMHAYSRTAAMHAYTCTTAMPHIYVPLLCTHNCICMYQCCACIYMYHCYASYMHALHVPLCMRIRTCLHLQGVTTQLRVLLCCTVWCHTGTLGPTMSRLRTPRTSYTRMTCSGTEKVGGSGTR